MHQLSVAMIVRDEALLLPECLEAASQWADEICVVDTGSTDGTLDILRESGCRMAEMPWQNDFSAPRNAAIDLCTGQWIFVLDADERLRPEDHGAIRALCDAHTAQGVRFVTRNYTDRVNMALFVPTPKDPEARGFPGWFPSSKVRLFPNRPDFRFEGLVHEMVNPAIERAGVPIVDTPIPVLHYPLLKPAAMLARKQDLYLRLGEAKCQAAPGDARAHGELGDQLMDMGEVARAAKAYRESVRCNPEDAARLKDLGTALFMLGHAEHATAFLEKAVSRNPLLADGWRNLGILHAQRQDWAEAGRCFNEALQAAPYHPDLMRYAALALHKQGRNTEAWEPLCRAVHAVPDHGAGRELWISVVASGEVTEAARQFLAEHGQSLPEEVREEFTRALARIEAA